MTPRRRRQQRGGWTIFELLAVIILIMPLVTGMCVARDSGVFQGIAAGLLNSLVSIFVVVSFYKIGNRFAKREQRMLLENYPSIYRVKEIPSDSSTMVTGAGVRIQVGDYGWQAEPIRQDGRIYLQGLTAEWLVVWHAGFTPAQVERIGAKPRSQYYLPYAWVCIGADPPPCPFAVQTHVDARQTLGHPTRIIGGFVQGRRVN